MFKTILRLVLFISLVLAAGQIRIQRETIAQHYLNGLRKGGEWTVDKVKETKVFAGLGEIKNPLPKDILNKLPSFGKTSKTSKSVEEELEDDEVGDADRDRVMRILK